MEVKATADSLKEGEVFGETEYPTSLPYTIKAVLCR